MKKIFFLLVFCGYLITTSCSVDVDIDDGFFDRITIVAVGSNADGSLSEGGYLDVEVSARDNDGIQLINIRIPTINIDQDITNVSRKDFWEINQRFNAATIIDNVERKVYVTLLDKDGNSYSKTKSFVVKPKYYPT